LHHLADPPAGWRVLLSLLRPHGILRVGLYSEAARRSIVEARTLIAERGYRAIPENIRAFRQTVIWGNQQSKSLLGHADFYSMSGCRDLLFNVMEHRVTIPQIAALLDDHGLSFLGFEISPGILKQFQARYPGAEALSRLDYWHEFEMANPHTFRQMYVFSVCKKERASR
jgi:hypothetical protein